MSKQVNMEYLIKLFYRKELCRIACEQWIFGTWHDTVGYDSGDFRSVWSCLCHRVSET